MKRLSATILALGCLLVGYAAGAGVQNLQFDAEALPEYAQLTGGLYLAGAALAAFLTTWALVRLRRKNKEASAEPEEKSTAQLIAELEA